MDFRTYVFSDPYWGWLCRGVLMTLTITLLTTVLALVLGGIVSTLRMRASAACYFPARIYINLFRNMPPVPLLLFLVLGLPGAFQAITGLPFPRGHEFPLLILGLSLNTSAYIAEILRSGMRGVPRGHWEAGRMLGLSPRAIRLKIIYPQALRIALPTLGTRLIHNMKNSTIALLLPLPVGMLEVLGQAGRIAGQTFAWAEPLLFAAAVHLSLALAFGAWINHLARKAQLRVEVAR